MDIKKITLAVLGLLAIGLGWHWHALRSAEAEVARQSGVPESHLELDGSGLGPDAAETDHDSDANLVSSSLSYRETIRRRVEDANKRFVLPKPPAMRSPSGAKDALQCEPPGDGCDPSSPLVARSWDEARWMRDHGFVDPSQKLAASGWSEETLDQRIRAGDPLAVAEMARRFLADGEELEAKEVLMQGVRNGNVYAAYQLAAVDEGRRLPVPMRWGLEWLFVARRMGDSQVDMSFIMSRYPDLTHAEIDHAMMAADRRTQQLGISTRSVRLRPDR